MTYNPRVPVVCVGLLVLGVAAYGPISRWAKVGDGGIVTISSDRTGAVIALSAAGRSSQIIGSGSSRIQLDPGRYLVSAADRGRVVYQVFELGRRESKTVSVRLDTPSPSNKPGDLTIDGSQELLDVGLSTEQIRNIRIEIFRFKNTVRSASIEPKSTRLARFQENTLSVSRYFKISIDDTRYDAELVTGASDSIRLILFSPDSKNVVFDSDTTKNRSYYGD